MKERPHHRVVLGTAALFILATAGSVLAQETPARAEVEETSLLGRTAGGFRRFISVETGVLLGAGALASYVTSRNESPLTSARQIDASVLEGGIDFGEAYAHGATVAVGAAGLLLAGQLGSEPSSAAGRDLAASLVVASTWTWALKVSVGRERPSGGPHSFPSGHTSLAFSTLPAVYRHGGTWLGLAATVLAAGAGAARIEDQHHYLSDVVFGAALGLAAGRAVVGGSSPWGDVWRTLTFSKKGVGVRVRF